MSGHPARSRLGEGAIFGARGAKRGSLAFSCVQKILSSENAQVSSSTDARAVRTRRTADVHVTQTLLDLLIEAQDGFIILTIKRGDSHRIGTCEPAERQEVSAGPRNNTSHRNSKRALTGLRSADTLSAYTTDRQTERESEQRYNRMSEHEQNGMTHHHGDRLHRTTTRHSK